MPVGGKNRAGVGEVFPGPALIAIILLTGCMGSDMSSMLRTGEDVAPSMVAGGSLAPQTEVQSSLIADLQARRSVLPPSGAFAKVADAVVAASAGAAAAELRVARLKAESRAKNWLPSIGPSVNLTSLSGLAASLLVETALFDNGRRKAEREFVAADVEVAAVGLSSSINQRVFEGLTYYLNAQRARALAVAMMEEVEVMTRAPLVLRDLQDTLRKCRAGEEIPADVMARADQLLGQALTVDSRAGTLKTLSETLIKVVAIERDTFHIDGGGDKPAGADASVLAGAMSAHAQRMEQAFAKATAAITAGAHSE